MSSTIKADSGTPALLHPPKTNKSIDDESKGQDSSTDPPAQEIVNSGSTFFNLEKK